MGSVGFIVKGVSSTKFEEARAEAIRRFELREKDRASAKESGIRMPRKLKLKDVRAEKMYHQIIFGPTVIKSAAEDAVELARRSGYLDVKVCKAEKEDAEAA